MGEYRNNPAIFDRLNYTKNLDKSNGVMSLQDVVAGNGDKMTSKQLYAFRRELRLRKAAKLLVFFSIPALTLYYKRNFALGAAAFVASYYLAEKVYSSCIFNSNESFTKEFIKQSKINYVSKIGYANELVLAQYKNEKIKYYTKKEFIELNKYR